MNKFSSIRKDWSLIETLIEEDRRILDIGCGDAKLMRQLENNINVKNRKKSNNYPRRSFSSNF